MDIDFVFTYVNSEDKIWQDKMIANAAKQNKKVNAVRFRDWGTLKYLFRGIEKNMPWIRNVYMVVERESQVPEWINKEAVNIIYHEQIIPQEFLPTYNSGTIEMFIYRIPGLSENFLFGNDDTFPINPTTPDMWYDEIGQPKIKVKIRNKPPYNMYTNMLKNTENLCCTELNLPKIKRQLLRSDHSINPMLKSTWELMWRNHKTELENSLSMFRAAKNITQELSNFYHFLSKKYTAHNRNNIYFDFSKYNTGELRNMLSKKDLHNICVNDNIVLDFKTSKTKVCKIFDKVFPNKSKYEI